MNYQEINKKLQNEFARKRIKAEKIANDNRDKLAKIPAFMHLIKLEKEVIFELAKAESANKKTAELSKVLKTIRKQKLDLLKAAKMTPDDLLPQFECKDCNDTGVFSGRLCSCYIRRRNAELVKASGIDASKLATFDKFNANICTDKTQGKKPWKT